MKKMLLIGLAISGFAMAALGYDRAAHEFKPGAIERLDPAFDGLLDKDAKLEKLAEGIRWAEGPTWYSEKDKNGKVVFNGVVFSDVLANTAYRWQEGWNHAEVFLRPSGMMVTTPGIREPGSNGMTLDEQGRLVLCQCGERRVARFEKGAFTVLADKFEGKRFNSPNDVVVNSKGVVYFTDPPYGLDGAKGREMDYCGVYRIGADGKVTLLTKELNAPNGVALSPDEKTLYVCNTDGRMGGIFSFEVKEDGTLGEKKVFFDGAKARGMGGLPDGLDVDKDGNLWVGGLGGVGVISKEGKLLGRILTNEATANVCWGDDGSTLYICADYFLLRIKTKTKGASWK